MINELVTDAELRAEGAEELHAFSGLKLLHIKRVVEKLLALIGRDGLFDQYTDHSIDHIDEMLRVTEWLIPDSTKASMTPTDWLLIVLSIYFHDLGLLVTKSEYENRLSSTFPLFKEEFLFRGNEGQDYKSKVERGLKDADDRERFLYQEFVRENHAQRVKKWILNSSFDAVGGSQEVVDELDNLLGELDSKFRSDLGKVCESHHLDDLGDTDKYPVSQPYGNSHSETANVQYAAVILRTADILHITRDRTPSVTFRVINPSDPISQREWAKQRAVRAVRPKIKKDEDGVAMDVSNSDIIEVHASFKQTDGFFGLTSYLYYADQQIKQSHEWIVKSNKFDGCDYEFPWKGIDDSNIEADGFLPKPFSFNLDQSKILDLLTGHTLYNDTGVVLRELIQNALDAVRLQSTYDGDHKGKVAVVWDEDERTLTVTDNGTGMTQAIIENHLLKVGSSRYVDPDFVKNNPEFSSISRFGIGVLSCFMIADEVYISTCHKDDEHARHLSLRSVHGKYLIELSEKGDSSVAPLCPNGTSVSIRVRASAKMVDVLKEVRKWIIIPGCDLSVQVGTASPVVIGYESPKEALSSMLEHSGYDIFEGSGQPDTPRGVTSVRVVQESEGSVQLAYALRWSKFFKEWEFLRSRFPNRHGVYDPVDLDDSDEVVEINTGSCIEGIRVEFGTPGYTSRSFTALANATGKQAPKTNVARSRIESTGERDAMLSAIYSMYIGHIENEVRSLHQERGFSLTWANDEAQMLMAPLIASGEVRPVKSDLLSKEIDRLKVLMVERDSVRENVSATTLRESDFWTSDSALIRSAEDLVREASGNASLSSIIEALDSPDFELPKGVFLSSKRVSSPMVARGLRGKEVAEIVVHPGLRRVDLKWSDRSQNPRWLSAWENVPRELRSRLRTMRERMGQRRVSQTRAMNVGVREVPVSGVDGEIAVAAHNSTFLLYGNSLASFAAEMIAAATTGEVNDDALGALATISIIESALDGSLKFGGVDELDKAAKSYFPWLYEFDGYTRFIGIAGTTKLDVFNPSAWQRQPDPDRF